MHRALLPTVDQLYERDNAICWLCTRFVKREVATRDHILPRGRRGRGRPVREVDIGCNVRLAHKLCNERRGAPIPEPQDFPWSYVRESEVKYLRSILKRLLSWWESTCGVPAEVLRFIEGGPPPLGTQS